MTTLVVGTVPLLFGGCTGDTSCAESKTCAGSTAGASGSDAQTSTGGGSGAGGAASGGADTDGSAGAHGGSGGSGGHSGSGGAGKGDAGPVDQDAASDAHALPPCDGSVSHAVAGCVIEDPTGLFVSPRGSDTTGTGSRSKPFATIAHAVASAGPPSDAGPTRHLYVCADAGTFAEAIAIAPANDDLAFSGGFRCSDWRYDPALKTKVAPATGSALEAAGLTKGLTVEDFDFRSPDATNSGDSSIGAIVSSSKNVVLRRVTIAAGNGANGARGADGHPGADGLPTLAEQAGEAATCTNPTLNQLGGRLTRTQCGGTNSGSGGDGLFGGIGSSGSRGEPLTDVTPPNVDNGGAAAKTVGQAATSGGVGSRGNDGSNGAQAPATGTFTAAGFATANGAYGTDGFTGQAGGGGGASVSPYNGSGPACTGAGGGGGGYGGCGGKHGVGGGGGGASVGLLIWSSDVRFESIAVTSKKGGDGGGGGSGGLGGKGQPGGLGGAGIPANNVGKGGDGGTGGNGGNGGSGAGGSGGPSYALVFHGTPPAKFDVSFSPGQGGVKGAGGSTTGASGAVSAPSGTDGDAAPQYEVP